jgi:hypothetical protein
MDPLLQAPVYPYTAGLFQSGNPWFNNANQFVPRNLHDVIKWARFITVQSPTTTETIRKYSTYPITHFVYDTKNDMLKKKYEDLTKQLKLKEFLQTTGFEFFTIGNSFISIYFPIVRYLVCPVCKTSYAAKQAPKIVFKQWEFRGTCPHCNATGIFIRNDVKSLNLKEINLIRWTPEHIVVNHNPITGESEYYYKIPNSVKQKILKGDRLFLDSVPWEFVEAVRYNQDFKFDKDNLFHLKNISSGGTVEGISVPPLLSLFSLVFYQATLRKANEAIATEYLNPMRVVFPQAQTANADPVVAMSLRNFKSHIEEAIRIHKRDKNYFLISPLPLGYQPIGGEGKNLLVSQEISQAEEQILLSLGVSRELLSGMTNWTSSSVGLRMLENTLFSYISRLEDLIEWIVTKTASYINMEVVKTTLEPFKLLDDELLKQTLTQLVMQDKASMTTLFEELNMDFSKEMKTMKEEKSSLAALQVEMQYEAEQAQFLAAKKAGELFKQDDEFKMALQKAQAMAEQLYSVDDNTRTIYLAQLKAMDYSQWLMVSKLLGDMLNQPLGPQNLSPEPNGEVSEGSPGKGGGGGESGNGSEDNKGPPSSNDEESGKPKDSSVPKSPKK